MPRKHQLMIAAYRFGSSGNSAAVGEVARHFGVSVGMVDSCTNLCIAALLELDPERTDQIQDFFGIGISGLCRFRGSFGGMTKKFKTCRNRIR